MMKPEQFGGAAFTALMVAYIFLAVPVHLLAIAFLAIAGLTFYIFKGRSKQELLKIVMYPLNAVVIAFAFEYLRSQMAFNNLAGVLILFAVGYAIIDVLKMVSNQVSNRYLSSN